MIKRHSVCDTGATVVPHDGKAVEPQLAHHGNAIFSHDAFRIGAMIRQPFGLVAVAITTQIAHDHGKTMS